MSANGKNIREMISQMKEFYEQISLLLRTVDAHMKKGKWDAINNYAIGGFSRHIRFPLWWQPAEAFRFYLSKASPKRLGFVSVLIDDDRDGRYEIEEPIVTGGYFDYKSKEEQNKDNAYFGYSKLFGILCKSKNLKADGQASSFKSSEIPSDLEVKFENGRIFGVPLVAIMNEKDVKQKITEKLLLMLKEKVQAASK